MNGDLLREFKDFILRGNVVDLAVAIVIGVAFTAVVTAFVDQIIMPIIAAIGGKPNFDSVAFNIGDGRVGIGTFISAVVTFVIIAAVVFFFVVKPLNMLLERTKTKEPAVAPPTPEEILLLREIRDTLRNR
jgi:large conductance mechanosensitive channel